MLKYTDLKDDKRKVLRDIIPLPKPFTLLIEPSSLCNFRCKMCFQSARDQGSFRDKRSNMSMECFQKVINQAKNWQGHKFKVLKLCLYGEPFMNPHFSEMLRIAKAANIAERIETTTNASLLTETLCRSLVEDRLDYLRVSIYSAIPEKHLAITESTITTTKIHANLQLLQRIKKETNSMQPFVAVKMLDTYNSEENEAFKDKYCDVADEIYIDQPHSWVDINDEKFMDQIYDNKSEIKQTLSERYACPMPFTTLAVRSNGDVAPCCVDWYGGTTIGSIYQQSLAEIWQGDALYNLRKLQLTKRNSENISCRGCSVYKSDYYTRDNIDGVSIDKLK